MTTEPTEIFLVCNPGLEEVLRDEAQERGFADPQAVPGGVTIGGGWPEVWRANLEMRGATRVLARIGSFRAFHLAQLDKRARKFPFGEVLRPDVPVSVEAVCRKSKIYHDRAAAQRIERALTETHGITVAKAAPVRIMARIEDDLVSFSVDTTGESLHKRGHKAAVGKAPMRETLAALFLRRCGFTGAEPVVDPMCGSGTFVIEAAEIALGLQAGRSRAFAFEQLAGFDAAAFAALAKEPGTGPDLRFFGSDRDAGAIANSRSNAERAGVAAVTEFLQAPISDLARPEGGPGLVIINPPYGGRIGNRKMLFALYGSMGEVLKERFGGWRVGIITDDGGLARATGLPFHMGEPPVDHGGLKVRLYRTDPLG
ncbi:hypothetical protein OB2597_13073 [Pseudooceanicola batsensis HTCC2597]|uniref:Uncharacterized protein n=1 Tax=Pseudooceanicola batsensis (strain ATCC BAA-863 / DSM 15984 / KCTC 12145 / HTCC2597) TaxID=252305 RepID=A3TY43_PSEBH|nr:RNA methyltransferase [Pseudooceanicola batsensis]EAQ03077.1 hypothetical protein OB2597_13073 [Pseudooceanicola batsensis HTCC2597]